VKPLFTSRSQHGCTPISGFVPNRNLRSTFHRLQTYTIHLCFSSKQLQIYRLSSHNYHQQYNKLTNGLEKRFPSNLGYSQTYGSIKFWLVFWKQDAILKIIRHISEFFLMMYVQVTFTFLISFTVSLYPVWGTKFAPSIRIKKPTYITRILK
jgi:hypothetical protein